MPKPNTGEHQQDFLKRCMGDAEANSSFPNQSQRYAFCNSQWNNKKTAMKDIYVYKDFAQQVNFKDADAKKGIVTGYFANFDSKDSDGDIIKKGAFARTIDAAGPNSAKPRIKHLLNHDVSQPLGVIQTLKEDNQGLYYESKIGNHNLGHDFIKMVESNLITEHSIGYQTIKFSTINSDTKDNETTRELTELKLWEGSSLTAWGANPNTPITGMKTSIELNKLLNKADAIEKFCRESKATDETIQMLLIYNKQLLQLITDLKSTQPAIAIVPEEEIDAEEEKAKETVTCPHCDHQMTMAAADAAGMVCDNCGKSMVKSSMPDVVECPACMKHTYNTQAEKGFVKCHRCNAMFNYGSKLFVKL